MESADSDEPEKKRPHLDYFSFPMARHSSTNSPDKSKSVDAAVLQYQNQKLVQQLDVQKHELHDFEAKIKELQDNQTSYDKILITVNQLWNQWVDDLIILGVRAGAGKSTLQVMDRADCIRGLVPSCPPEEIFLYKLLELDFRESSGSDGSLYVKEALASRHSATLELMKFLEDTIEAQRAKAECISQVLNGKPSAEDVIIQLSKIDNLMKAEASNLHEVIDILRLKHKEYADGIQTCIHSHSVDQSEIRRLTGDLEESMTELEESRRKLVNLKMQTDVASGVQTPVSEAVNGTLSPEKNADKTMGLRELKDSIEETKILADDRLAELQDAQEDNLILSKQLQDLQNELKDENYVHSSRTYTLLNDQLQHWSAEVERYKMLTDTLQADRSSVMRREKELNVKAESVDVAKNRFNNADSKIEELEQQLQKCVTENNELEIKMEEAVQDSALSKEMGLMEAQLNRWKEIAHEAVSLREEAQSLKDLLSRKTSEQKILVDKCAEQVADIKSLKELIEKSQKEKQELQIFVDMLGQQIYDNRDVLELNEAIKIKDGEAEAYISEIETIGQAYEDMQTQNQHLLQQVTERDEYNIKLVSESVKTKQAQNFLLSEKQALEKQLQQVNTLLESLKLRIAHGEEQMKFSITEALKSTQEDRHLAVNLETAKWELADAEKELKWLKSVVSSSEKEYEQVQRKMDEIQKELEIERGERKKLDDELMELNRKVDELSSESGEAAIQKLQDEIKDCKAILKCGVCFDRPKEVVIVKCYHLFCNPCIQRNLEIRHRKCPGCGTAFGLSDVRFVKI